MSNPAVAFVKEHWKPIAAIGGGALALVLIMRAMSGGSSAVAAIPTTASTGTDNSLAWAQLAAADSAQKAQTTVQLAGLDAQTYAVTVAAQGQVAQQAIATSGLQTTASLQALANGFGNFVMSQAQEVSSVATAAGNLGVANDRATSQNIAALGELLAGAGQLVGAVSGAGAFGGGGLTKMQGLPSGGFSAIGGTNLPVVLMPSTNSGLLK